jgi:4-hydroxy-tetrahydrodipicolinate synthase
MRLAKISNIIGVKDATADLTRPAQVRETIGPDFIQLSGEDATVADFLAAGGHGCISVTSNVAPGLCADLHNAWMADDKARARAINERLMPLHKALFCETSPAPAKYGLSRLGLCTDEMRLPLVPASAVARKAMDDAMDAVKLEEMKKAA